MLISDCSSDVCSSDLTHQKPRRESCAPHLTMRRAKTSSMELWPTTIFWPLALPGCCSAHSRSISRCRHRRSEERRVGTECVRTCRSRWSLYHSKKITSRINYVRYYISIE